MSGRRLTIAQLVPEMDNGGVERGTVETARELVARGHRSIVISGGGQLVEQLADEGSEHIIWPIGAKSIRTFGLVPRLKRFAKKQQVDVLHARSRVPAWVAYLATKTARRAARPKFLTTVHGLYSVNRYSSVMVRGDAVSVISNTVQRYVRANYPGIHPAELPVMFRGVDPSDYRPDYTPSESWQAAFFEQNPGLAGRKLIGLAGRITRCKGHLEFVEALARLRETRDDFAGVIVGGEDARRTGYADSVRDAIARHGLGDRIVMLGHRRDIREIIAQMDLTVSCTMDPPEAFGRTVLESLSLGVPVVGFDGSGPGEILRELCPSGLVPTGNVPELCSRLHQFLDEPPTVRPNTVFTLKAMVDAEVDLYERVVGEGVVSRIGTSPAIDDLRQSA